MKWGLVGFGSIGARHADLIKSFGDEVVVVTKNTQCPFPTTSTVSSLLESGVELVIIANETSKHLLTYEEIRKLNSTIPILIEKPLFANFVTKITDPFCFVAYCLRFHPLIEKLKTQINGEIISAHFYVGQYLPSWRPSRDYRETYSAKKSEGGGVLRDLSHELDLATYFLGLMEPKFIEARKLSNLEIDSDDTFSGVFKSKICPVITVQMNYLDRINQRFFTLISNEKTYRVDFITGEIRINDQIEKVPNEKNQMYESMLKSFRNKTYERLTTFAQGLEVLKIISATGDPK